MNLTIFLLALFDGISYAALVFIVALGLTLIFGVMRILNIAHGSLYAIGAYATVSLTGFFLALGFAPVFAFPLMLVSAVLVGVLLGGPIEWLLLRRIYDKPEVLQLLVTFAVFMILEDVQRLVWGTQPYFQASALQALGNVTVFGVTYTVYQLILLPMVAIGLLLGLRFFLRHTVIGKLILATTEDREAAQSIGIDAERVFLFTFTVGAVLAGLGGALASPTTSILPGMGADMIVLSFAVVATAGLGQIGGAAVAALMIGLGRSFAVYVWPEVAVLVPYLIMVLVLLVRPEGLFGSPVARKI
ncbi:ABC transporter permease [Salipiger aestuarii]|uniref:Amino acid/amide ABC transporter membrane protein 1 (HAAT family) n=1 Tax=Salipiger aestuarii TaxID=568098 RepID=A0A327XUM8_9RHOB|nr:branched-chain amino acid ABC transporter permease [Salipiger aestuarii]EIE49976.1 inner-membrane translocator [Citreicella sp. 357]KAA8605618.1 ABC transporter permease [Salipiger aestuarii]KAA8608235.1 ABC transporter permease [Salipiger aestuarii]KAB2539812.1 ABC transporter permease [Salipiger aestuarii]RAK12002.1 amino acid/amide ABC transporter membrane protein 1 (HAAT family) [Salipiger aestuarii]